MRLPNLELLCPCRQLMTTYASCVQAQRAGSQGCMHAANISYTSATHYMLAGAQKAKDLHPDLNSRWSASDGEAFLRLVTAYEVLSDPQQRQLYDISNNPGLPDVLRRTTASAQQYGAERQTDDRPGDTLRTTWWLGKPCTLAPTLYPVCV